MNPATQIKNKKNQPTHKTKQNNKSENHDNWKL